RRNWPQVRCLNSLDLSLVDPLAEHWRQVVADRCWAVCLAVLQCVSDKPLLSDRLRVGVVRPDTVLTLMFMGYYVAMIFTWRIREIIGSLVGIINIFAYIYITIKRNGYEKSNR